MTETTLVENARAQGIRLTPQRELVCNVLEDATDHPDVDRIYERCRQVDPAIAIATVYRTLRVLEDHELIASHAFGNRKSRYELTRSNKHNHLIDTGSGEVINFDNDEIDAMINEIASRMGYTLERHQLELYGQRSKD
ncbi:MAG: Fur family transcriptional regulator [Pseudomonadota bacterium]